MQLLLGWLADRLGLSNPVTRAADGAGSHTTLPLATLTVTALAATVWTVRRRLSGGPKPLGAASG